MAKTCRAFFFVVVARFAMIAHGAESPATGIWEKNAMNQRVNVSLGQMLKIQDVKLLPSGAPNPGDPHCTTAAPCTFDLLYTTGAQFGLKKNGFNILFIPGGPGQIIGEADSPGGCNIDEQPPDCTGDAP